MRLATPPAESGLSGFHPNRELRFGLVLYGGVSLAVYINGVARELYRASRGQGFYTLLKILTDSDIVVDIISGTSAGGINGVFLGFALCNDKEFRGFQQLWRNLGDISALMRDPDRDPSNCRSLLDSEGYYQSKLAAAFRDREDVTPNPNERVTPVKELDVFVTGTDVYGDISTVFDDSGNPIDVKNHRAVFRLKHREGRTGDLCANWSPKAGEQSDADVGYHALAKVCRLTSAFPAAFSPVHVENDPPGQETVDGRLQRWGALQREAYFMDGGVLNNKPFTMTIREIFYRMADRDVERRLLYVEPDPERFRPDGDPREPGFLQQISDALVNIPGYQSIAADLEELSKHNSRVDLYNELAARVTAGGGNEHPDSDPAYVTSRLTALRDRAVEGVLKSNGKRGRLTERQRKAARNLIAAFHDFDQIDPLETLRCFDVYTRARRLLHLTYVLRKRLGEPEAQRLLAAVNYLIGSLEAIQYAMERLVDQTDFAWEELASADGSSAAAVLWRRVGNAYRRLLTPPGMGEFRRRLLDRALGLATGNSDPISDLLAAMMAITAGEDDGELALKGWNGLLQETDAVERELLEWFEERSGGATAFATREYDNFAKVDASLYPAELVAGMPGKDRILLTRISPADARRGFCARDLADKVAGDQFFHFGAFFKRSWRANDILWGRLDGTCQLVECVFTEGRFRKALENGAPQRWLADGAAPWGPMKLFAGAGKAGEALDAWLRRAFDPATREEALSEFERYQTLLIEAAQWLVLSEELPEVQEDALLEQAEWNLFRTANGQATQGFVAGGGDVDRGAAALQAEDWARRAVERLRTTNAEAPTPGSTGLGSYFRENYRIGGEEVARDVPTPVLLEVYARAALLTRNCILTALGPAGERISSNTLYTLFLDAPMRIFHAWVTWWRRSPAEFRYRQTLVTAVAAVMLIVAWAAGGKLLKDEDGVALLPTAVFVLLPAAVLGSQGYFLLRRRPRWRAAFQAALTLGALAALVVLVVWSGGVYSAAEFKVGEWRWPQWMAAPLAFGAPILFSGLVLLVASRIRAAWRPRVASVGEMRCALTGLDEAGFQIVTRAFPVKGQTSRKREELIPLILEIVWKWGWWCNPGERKRLEGLVRSCDREALPSLSRRRLRFTLDTYFAPEHHDAIRKEMQIAGDLFPTARREHRLAELERRMRAIHPGAL